MNDTVKYLLDETQIPKAWYNMQADLPSPPPPVLHPGTLKPVGPDDLAPLFPMSLIMQEVSTEREIEIPEPVRDVYRQWRPTPLYRARRLEQALQTPARIYYKYEGVTPGRQPQAQHRGRAGVLQQGGRHQAARRPRPAPDSGALRSPSPARCSASRSRCSWCACRTTRSRIAARSWKPSARAASPARRPRRSPAARFSRSAPDTNGSLGIAISEAVEVAAQHDDTKYALGSVLNHVLLHQTVIGQEAMAQMEMADDYPDVVVGCTGGGSNFAGIAFPFIGAQLRGGRRSRSSPSNRPRARA